MYAVRFKGEIETEARKFFSTYSLSHKDDTRDIVALIADAVDRRGLSDQHCRPEEGRITDCIIALPGRNKDTERIIGPREELPELRLYALRLAKGTIILYSGGIKPEGKHSYQEVPELNDIVRQLQHIEKLIIDRIHDFPYPELCYQANDLSGNLDFEID